MTDNDLPGAGTDTTDAPLDDTTPEGCAITTSGRHSNTPPPDWLVDEVEKLLKKMAAPEAATNTGLAERADPSAIEDSISPPEPTWTWADYQARDNQIVRDFDVGKYGVQTDIHKLFKLTSINPPVWQPVRDFSVATWVWRNIHAREKEVPKDDDVGKVGYQADIDTYFKLAQATPAAVWKEAPNPHATSTPLSLSTGASDADSFHDFYRLQIAFEDVWAELIDKQVELTAHEFYAKWDALVNEGEAFDVNDEQYNLVSEIELNIKSAIQENDPGNFQIPINILIDAIDHIKADSSVFWQSFGLDLLNTKAQLELALYELRIAGNVSQNALNALNDALQNIVNLKAKLSNGAAARKAAFSMIPFGVIGGYNDLVRFMDGVRVVLGLPPASTATEDFDKVINIIRSVRNPLDAIIPALNNPFFTHLSDSLKAAETELTALQSKYKSAPPGSSGEDKYATALTFPEIETLFHRLSDMLKERYRFDIFAPGSINYGLLLNYRQHWKPQSYQVGSLVKTIPLAPRETQKYTTKTVVKKSRNAKELDESLRTNKEDKSETQRVDAEIFTDSTNKTDFKANASGSFNIGAYNINADTHLDKNQAAESRNTKKNQREEVLKSAQEYRNQHKLEVTTDSSQEDETTSYREISNPNDELTVTYLFYELQRRYIVSETLHRATPVILVGNDVPAPHEIDQAWLVRHDWILKRAILDDSFLPALQYLATDYTGDETALIVLEMNVQHQKAIVDKLSQQVQLANQSLDTAAMLLQTSENQAVQNQQDAEIQKQIKAFFDPLGIGQAGAPSDGNSDRARVEFARDTLERTQAKVNDLRSQMRTELTVLQVAIDRYTTAASRHYGMLAQINRLRLHVKDNILHYMQAIWSNEPADQRYFRLYNLDVPVFEHNTTLTATSSMERFAKNPDATALVAVADPGRFTTQVSFETPMLSDTTKKLHQVADIDNLLGYKGNYMIFPLTDFNNYMTWYLVHNYIQFDTDGEPFVSDPDANITSDDLHKAMEAIHAQKPQTFAKFAYQFVEVMTRLLSNEAEHMVIVPSDQLYIEALPGTHPLLEDFKLKHRALDVMKVQAEVRKAELENLRLAARLVRGELGDPDVEKKIVIEGGVPVTVNPGD